MAYRTGFSLHRAVDGAFSTWSLEGCALSEGCLVLDAGGAGRGAGAPASGAALGVPRAAPGASTGAALFGQATSPELEPGFSFASCVPSWNADAPAGAWLELWLRARTAGAWTSWRCLGVWAADESVIKRSSVEGQDDDAAKVATDTLNLAAPASAFQARFKLFCAAGPDPVDSPAESTGILDPVLRRPAMLRVRAFSLAYSDEKPGVGSIEPSAPRGAPPEGALGLVLDGVPRCSQMVYPNGGNVWCSPTSVSMVLGYWSGSVGPCEARVRAAVAGVYDHVYDGHGNWSFNAAYAGSKPGMEAYAARFTGLDRLEPWIAAGVPVVLSVSWNNDEGRVISAAPVPKSSGHLTTLVGFDASGNAVMNEPASPSDETVRRVYDRRELETRWLAASGGLAYIIFPSGAGAGADPGSPDRAGLFASTVGA